MSVQDSRENNQQTTCVCPGKQHLIPKQQYGFRKGRSTTDVVVILQNHIAKAFRKRESTTMVSLDISKAYDMSWRYAIVKMIKD
jgi:hypothetical protein